jgi:MFS family permease
MGKRGLSDSFLNIGHALDHLFMLIYPTVVLAIGADVVGGYGEALTLSLGGFIAFGACSLPAGWLGDRWSRHGMIIIFVVGIGAASILTGLARTPFGIAAGLTLIGVFAAIYHPIGIAMLVGGRDNVGRTLGINGVAGNLGVAFAALIAAGLADLIHWRAAFVVPGAVSVTVGIAYALWAPRIDAVGGGRPAGGVRSGALTGLAPSVLWRVFAVIVVATTFGGVIFNGATVAIPKLFDMRLSALTDTTFGVGALVCFVYVLAAVAQLIVGYLIDRGDLKAVFVAIALGQAPFLFLAARAEGYAMLIVAVAMMFVVFGQIPINDAMVARYVSDEWRSRAYALRYVVSFGASAVAVSLVALVYRATGGFEPAFLGFAAMALGTLIAAFMLPGRRPAGAPVAAGE